MIARVKSICSFKCINRNPFPLQTSETKKIVCLGVKDTAYNNVFLIQNSHPVKSIELRTNFAKSFSVKISGFV